MTRPGSHDNVPPREPLDAEERALAERLARLGPHGAPPSAVDERILAAANAATNATPRRARRFPLALGVAASLVLALGLAWQLRPLLDPPPPPVHDSADRAATRAVDPAPAADGSEVSGLRATAEEPADGKAGAGPSGDPVPPPPMPAPAPPAAPQSGEPLRAPAIAPPQAFPVPAPPPPPPAPVAREIAPAAPAPTADTAAAEAAEAAMRRRAAESQRSLDRGEAGDAQAMQESAAAADDAAARHDAHLRQLQLERIRALRDAGYTAQAREELDAFLARWPGYPLPDDLLPLRR
jgi:resuscitation-promoting factor RpfA